MAGAALSLGQEGRRSPAKPGTCVWHGGDGRSGAPCSPLRSPKDSRSTPPTNQTPKTPLEPDTLRCKGLAKAADIPLADPASFPQPSRSPEEGKIPFDSSAERNLASALMDWDPGGPRRCCVLGSGGAGWRGALTTQRRYCPRQRLPALAGAPQGWGRLTLGFR